MSGGGSQRGRSANRSGRQVQIAVSDESVDLRWWPIEQLPDGTDAALTYLVQRAAHGRE